MGSSLRIIIASDSFKGSLSSRLAADAIEVGVRRAYPLADCVKIPIADGGEGTVDAVLSVCGGEWITVTVTSPMGALVKAEYGIIADGNTAIIEMAAASGLTLVPLQERDPLNATTYGTGELILDAVRRGVKQIIVGIGGSATIDGGVGLAQAVGVQFFDSDDALIAAPIKARDIAGIMRVDASRVTSALRGVEIIAACDVDNHLCGETGAANVFGRQKGASEADIKTLDKALFSYGELIRTTIGVDILGLTYAGAGGGTAAGLAAFMDATPKPGIGLIAELIDLAGQIKGADLVITGEGAIDGQTVHGKAPLGVAMVAKRHGVPVLAIGGQLADDAGVVYHHGIDCLESAYARHMPVEQAISGASSYIAYAAERALRLIKVGQGIGQGNG